MIQDDGDDGENLHHHFEFHGWSEEKIVMRFWLIHAFFVIVAVWMSLYK